MGDLNDIKDNSEKKGGALASHYHCRIFNHRINNYGLIDLVSKEFLLLGSRNLMAALSPVSVLTALLLQMIGEMPIRTP